MQPSFLHRLFWGIVLVGVGVVFLLNQTGAASVNIGQLFATFWPVFVIMVGLQGLLLQRSGGFVWNMIVVLVGVVFLGRNMGWFEWGMHDLFSMIGPVILILFGLGMITRGSRCKREKHETRSYGWNPITPPPAPEHQQPPEMPLGPPPAPPLSDDPNASFSGGAAGGSTAGMNAGGHTHGYPPRPDMPPAAPYESDERERVDRWQQRMEERMERKRQRWERRHYHGHGRHHHEHGRHHWSYDPNAAQHHRFIGDVHIGQDYWELRPMNISHFIGDTTLDLTKAQIPVGETRIYVSCFIGDVKVFVPNDPGIGVQVVSSSLIGDVRVWDHKRGGFFNQMSVETPSYSDADKRIVLIASAFIGDVRVTKVG